MNAVDKNTEEFISYTQICPKTRLFLACLCYFWGNQLQIVQNEYAYKNKKVGIDRKPWIIKNEEFSMFYINYS